MQWKKWSILSGNGRGDSTPISAKTAGEVSRQIIDAGARHLRIGVVDEDVAPASRSEQRPASSDIRDALHLGDTSVRRRPFENVLQASVSGWRGTCDESELS